MFGVGFSELLLIGIVALVVIGPERLPKVARTAGLLLGRLQRYVATVKADISQEMQLDELHRASASLKESMQNTRQEIGSAISELHQSIHVPPDPPETPETPSILMADKVAADGAIDEENRQIELPLETSAGPVATVAPKPAIQPRSVEPADHTDKADPAA
ncbi:MAG TPA: Sec-independent protein translocase protein TatB [Burkholderiales bacterium]|nr:Sec-independent protein translocase protein TatB [Burkholderiales bacterium]